MLVANLAFSQQELQVSHNMFNLLDVNPGYAGLSGAICATAIARDQWVGFKDPDGNNVNPRTYLLSVDAPFKRYNGIGLTIIQDQLGYEKNMAVKLSYSRHMFIGKGKVGWGLQVDFLNKRIDFTKFNPLDDGDQLLINGNSKEGNMLTDATIGAFYDAPGSFYLGASLSQCLTEHYSLPNVLAKPSAVPHFYLTAGNYIRLTPALELAPSLFFKTDFASLQIDANALLKINNQYWCGLSWRMSDAVAVIIGGTLPGGLAVSYAYDITISAMGASGRSFGSHEIMLHYCFKIVPPPKFGILNVRYLSPSIEK